MSAEIYLISKMEEEGRLTSAQAKELKVVSMSNDIFSFFDRSGEITKNIYY
ncbi:MAG: hypothetical protein R6V47_04890 [Candidatus Delongbacteria bacterium]